MGSSLLEQSKDPGEYGPQVVREVGMTTVVGATLEPELL